MGREAGVSGGVQAGRRGLTSIETGGMSTQPGRAAARANSRVSRRRAISLGGLLLGGVALGGLSAARAGDSRAETVPDTAGRPRAARSPAPGTASAGAAGGGPGRQYPAEVSPEPGTRPVALVYRGPAATPGCPEAVASLLGGSQWNLDVRYAGPGEPIPLTPSTLAGAALYAQPGGGDLTSGYDAMRGYAAMIGQYVAGGGRYLGFCLGGYLAGNSPGFDLLPGDASRYLGSPGATVSTDADTVVEVDWLGRRRHMFFQDGPFFSVPASAPGTSVLGRYPNGEIAAVVAAHGSGRVGVVGPHPEAAADWYANGHLTNPDGIDFGPGHDLVDAVLRA